MRQSSASARLPKRSRSAHCPPFSGHLTLQTTIKYITIVLSADNNGEGGVFSLYTLIYEKAGKWILYPTIIGGSFYPCRRHYHAADFRFVGG
ncbi:MAG: KUP/HAK/KT family potassium transporter [Pyrinomonadaceae bacterium]